MWIELHDTIRDHPKVLKLARELEILPVQVIGHLCSLWTWTLRMAPDGDLCSFDGDDIETAAMWHGQRGVFLRAALQLSLIDRGSEGYMIHDWPDFSGSLKAAKRARTHRIKKRASRDSNVTVTLPSRDSTVISRRPTDRPTDRPDQTDQTDIDTASRDSNVTIAKPGEGIRKAVVCVFDYWKERHPDEFMTPHGGLREWREIERRLSADSIPAGDIFGAIDGIHLDDWKDRDKNLTLLAVVKSPNSIQRFLRIRDNAGRPKIGAKTKRSIDAMTSWLKQSGGGDESE